MITEKNITIASERLDVFIKKHNISEKEQHQILHVHMLLNIGSGGKEMENRKQNIKNLLSHYDCISKYDAIIFIKSITKEYEIKEIIKAYNEIYWY